VCVLGEGAKINLLGYDEAVGKFIKVNDTWLQVIGVLTPQASGDRMWKACRRSIATTW
jgi:putative ABC transport system permease protein